MSKRIEYIDALRGFTMILVVLGHVEYFSFGSDSDWTKVLPLFRMPLFFFVSGLLSCKYLKGFKSYADFCNEIKRKIRTLLLPVCFWGVLYSFFKGNTLNDFFYSPEKLGYWFTISLFEIFIIYFSILYFLAKCILKKWSIKILFIISILTYLLSFKLKSDENLWILKDIFSLHCTFTYFQYFMFGVLFSYHKEKLNSLFSKTILTSLLIVLILCMHFYHRISTLNIEDYVWIVRFRDILFLPLIGYLGIFLIYGYFRSHQAYFAERNLVGRCLSSIGKRTLDIYVLHYFLLPNMPKVSTYFHDQPNLTLELSVGLFITLMVIYFSLFISHLLRHSKIVGYYLFGVKQRDGQS